MAFLLALFVAGNVQAQSLAVTPGSTANEMAQTLVGEGVEIINATTSGLPEQRGLFTSDMTELGDFSGILLSSGRALNAVGPNDDSGLPTLDGSGGCVDCDLFDLDQPGDADLSALVGGNTWDAAALEFDVIVQGDSLKFDFTFGSEEYLEWVGSPFNDAFAFLISGPGITGTQNLAVVPGTSTPISVNTINNIDNTEYFYDNQDPLGNFVQYDGFTTGLTAEIGGLTPCETYHLKLVVADGSDRLYDTGVFISAIESNPVTILTSTAAGVDFMVEGCNDGSVTLQTTFVPTVDLDVLFSLEGDAVLGTDFTTVPDLAPLFDADLGVYVVTLPAGTDTFSFDILPLADGVAEGVEFVTITLVEQLCESILFSSSVDFAIEDAFIVNVAPGDASICLGQCVDFSATINLEGATGWSWSPDDALTDPSAFDQTVCPGDDITYVFEAMLGNCVSSDSIVIQIDSLNLQLTTQVVTCVGGDNGSIDLTMLDGVGPYTFDWTGPDGFVFSDEDPSGLAAGEYCVTVIDSEGCTGQACITVIEDNVLSFDGAVLSDYTCDEISCNGASDGSIDISVSGGTGVYSFDWTGPDDFASAAEDQVNLSAGTYSVVITDEVGCQVTASFVLSEPDLLDIELVGQVDILCTGESTGSATVTSTGGCPPYFYNWSHDPGLNTPVALDLPSGSYSVSVSDANGCTSTDVVDITILEPSDPLEITTESITTYPGGFNVSCAGATDGAVDVSLSGGIGAYTITWTDADGLFVTNTEDLSGVACGVYTLTVNDENGCVATETYDLICVPEIAIEFTTVANPCGDPNAGLGEITITSISGGTGGFYTVTWLAGPSCPCPSGISITGLDSGIYTAEVADIEGCTATFDINIGTNDSFSVGAVVEDGLCAGDSTGSIDLTVIPLTGTYTFDWDGPDGYDENTEDITDVPAGSYQVTVDGGACVETFVYTISEPDPIVIDTLNTIAPLCFGVNNGALEAVASGGTGALDIEWLPSSDPSCFFSGSSDAAINNLFECWYTAQVTDDNMCTAVDSFFLDAPNIMEIFVSVTDFDGGFEISCNGANDGAISVTVSGGTPDPVTFDPYDYLYDWSDGDDVTIWGNDPNADFVDNLGPGTYTVQAFDANGCLATTSVSIDEPDPIESAEVVSDYNGFGVSCTGATDGFINPNVIGGSGDFDLYSWTGPDLGANDPTATNLVDIGPGTYCLTITDSNGCEEELCFTLTEPTPVEGSIISTSDATCFGYCDGTISADATGGAGGYTYAWTDEDGAPYAGNVLAAVCAGNYEGVITDLNGCTDIVFAEILQPDTFIVTLSVPSQSDGPFDLNCFGDDNGSINFLIEGGVAEFTYEWSDCDGNFISNGSDISGLEAGCYELVVTDDTGCEASSTVDITEPDAPVTVDYTTSLYSGGFNISCFGACDGTIDTDVSGGVPGYTYLWHLNGSDVIISEDDVLNDLCAGLYDVLVTDLNGCDTTLFIELTEPDPIETGLILSDFNGFNISCNGECDGTIDISPSGGQGTIDVDWIDLGSAATSLTELCAGQYVLSLTDAADCELIQVIDLVEPDPLLLGEIVTDINCNGELGGVSLNVTGGVEPFDYDWSNDDCDGSPDCLDLEEDTYDVTVTDANGCSISGSWTFTEPEPLAITSDILDATCGACDGVVDNEISGGTAPYTVVSWTPAVPDPGALDQVDLCPGTYTLTIEDANGCIASFDIVIGGPPPVTATPSITNLLCHSECIGAIDVVFEEVQDPATYTWTDGNGDPVGEGTAVADLCAGDYTVTVDHGDGCQDVFDFSISQPDSLALEISSPEYPNGYNVSSYNGSDGEIITEVSGGIPDYSYEWDGPGEIDPDDPNPFDLPAGEYTLTITDQNGCVVDTTITLTQPFDITLPTGLSPNGDGDNDAYVILGVEEHPENRFIVFNRWGNVVYELSGYQNDWVGQSDDGGELPDGTYFVIFEADDRTFNTYVDLRR